MENQGSYEMNRIILHIDMDAFYASIEMRDNPKLRGKPLIIGALPHERGVVATCSYEARKFGIHSAMNIKEAYRRCPNGIYRRPNIDKYRAVSKQIREIWNSFTPLVETVAFDEAYLDITDQVHNINEARIIAHTIKQRIKKELKLTCSVGLAYSKTAAKTASEEKKPNGYFEILSPDDFVNLIIDRDVKALHTVGEKTSQKLYESGIHTVRDVRNNKERIIKMLGKQGELIVKYSNGIDDRIVAPSRPEDAKSISREVTFQEDTSNYELLKDVLVLLALCVENKAKHYGLYGNGITLKLTYGNMKSITRSTQTFACDSAILIWQEAISLLENVDKEPVRLVGVGIHNLSKEERQISILDYLNDSEQDIELSKILEKLHKRYNLNFSDNIDKIFHSGVLHRTVEYMRKHFN